ncbi:hypothetical protein DPV78_012104 [Talaromyces pinophilus]|nr:hypothetical protein DPV78_012104 [Talaromyces pinophilus]
MSVPTLMRESGLLRRPNATPVPGRAANSDKALARDIRTPHLRALWANCCIGLIQAAPEGLKPWPSEAH